MINTKNFFGLEKPLFDLIDFKKFNDLPVLIKNIDLAIIYRSQDTLESKEINFKINNQLLYDNEFTLTIKNDKDIISSQDFYYNENKGLYFYLPTVGQINLSFDIEYNQKNRHFIFNKQFTFENNLRTISSSHILKDDNIKNINLPMELQSEKIF